MLVIKEACSSLCSIPSPSAEDRTEGLLDARQAPGREFSSVLVSPKRVLIPNSSYCSIDLVPTSTSDNDWSTWCLCAFAILFVCFKSTESYNMPSCDWNLSPNIFLKFISYERHQLSVPFMLLSSILLYNIHCVHPFTSWYRPSGIFLFETIMNIIKALVFKYFCGYVFFFFFTFISLEYMPGGRIVCLSFLFATWLCLHGYSSPWLSCPSLPLESLEEMVNQIAKRCLMWESLCGGEKVFPKENYSSMWLNMRHQSTEEEELKCLGVCFLLSFSLMLVCSFKQF